MWPRDTPDHTDYNHQLQPFRARCARTGHDPGAGAARWAYAAELARTHAENLIPWPPPCNARAGAATRKDKKCCRHRAALPSVPG